MMIHEPSTTKHELVDPTSSLFLSKVHHPHASSACAGWFGIFLPNCLQSQIIANEGAETKPSALPRENADRFACYFCKRGRRDEKNEKRGRQQTSTHYYYNEHLDTQRIQQTSSIYSATQVRARQRFARGRTFQRLTQQRRINQTLTIAIS